MLSTLIEPQLTWITPAFAVTAALAPGDFAVLASRGIASIISNRPDGEEADQMLAKSEAAGRSFRSVGRPACGRSSVVIGALASELAYVYLNRKIL